MSEGLGRGPRKRGRYGLRGGGGIAQLVAGRAGAQRGL